MSRLNLLFVLLITCAASFAMAKHGDRPSPPPSTGEWTCLAQGRLSTGFPGGGDIWQSRSGNGATEGEAQMDALSSCHSSGLQMCSIQSCWQK